MVQDAHYLELTEHLLIFLWPRRVIFTVILMFLTTLEDGPYRVTQVAVRIVVQKPTHSV